MANYIYYDESIQNDDVLYEVLPKNAEQFYDDLNHALDHVETSRSLDTLHHLFQKAKSNTDYKFLLHDNASTICAAIKDIHGAEKLITDHLSHIVIYHKQVRPEKYYPGTKDFYDLADTIFDLYEQDYICKYQANTFFWEFCLRDNAPETAKQSCLDHFFEMARSYEAATIDDKILTLLINYFIKQNCTENFLTLLQNEIISEHLWGKVSELITTRDFNVNEVQNIYYKLNKKQLTEQQRFELFTITLEKLDHLESSFSVTYRNIINSFVNSNHPELANHQLNPSVLGHIELLGNIYCSELYHCHSKSFVIEDLMRILDKYHHQLDNKVIGGWLNHIINNADKIDLYDLTPLIRFEQFYGKEPSLAQEILTKGKSDFNDLDLQSAIEIIIESCHLELTSEFSVNILAQYINFEIIEDGLLKYEQLFNHCKAFARYHNVIKPTLSYENPSAVEVLLATPPDLLHNITQHTSWCDYHIEYIEDIFTSTSWELHIDSYKLLIARAESNEVFKSKFRESVKVNYDFVDGNATGNLILDILTASFGSKGLESLLLTPECMTNHFNYEQFHRVLRSQKLHSYQLINNQSGELQLSIARILSANFSNTAFFGWISALNRDEITLAGIQAFEKINHNIRKQLSDYELYILITSSSENILEILEQIHRVRPVDLLEHMQLQPADSGNRIISALWNMRVYNQTALSALIKQEQTFFSKLLELSFDLGKDMLVPIFTSLDCSSLIKSLRSRVSDFDELSVNTLQSLFHGKFTEELTDIIFCLLKEGDRQKFRLINQLSEMLSHQTNLLNTEQFIGIMQDDSEIVDLLNLTSLLQPGKCLHDKFLLCLDSINNNARCELVKSLLGGYVIYSDTIENIFTMPSTILNVWLSDTKASNIFEHIDSAMHEKACDFYAKNPKLFTHLTSQSLHVLLSFSVSKDKNEQLAAKRFYQLDSDLLEKVILKESQSWLIKSITQSGLDELNKLKEDYAFILNDICHDHLYKILTRKVSEGTVLYSKLSHLSEANKSVHNQFKSKFSQYKNQASILEYLIYNNFNETDLNPLEKLLRLEYFSELDDSRFIPYIFKLTEYHIAFINYINQVIPEHTQHCIHTHFHHYSKVNIEKITENLLRNKDLIKQLVKTILPYDHFDDNLKSTRKLGRVFDTLYENKASLEGIQTIIQLPNKYLELFDSGQIISILQYGHPKQLNLLNQFMEANSTIGKFISNETIHNILLDPNDNPLNSAVIPRGFTEFYNNLENNPAFKKIIHYRVSKQCHKPSEFLQKIISSPITSEGCSAIVLLNEGLKSNVEDEGFISIMSGGKLENTRQLNTYQSTGKLSAVPLPSSAIEYLLTNEEWQAEGLDIFCQLPSEVTLWFMPKSKLEIVKRGCQEGLADFYRIVELWNFGRSEAIPNSHYSLYLNDSYIAKILTQDNKSVSRIKSLISILEDDIVRSTLMSSIFEKSIDSDIIKVLLSIDNIDKEKLSTLLHLDSNLRVKLKSRYLSELLPNISDGNVMLTNQLYHRFPDFLVNISEYDLTQITNSCENTIPRFLALPEKTQSWVKNHFSEKLYASLFMSKHESCYTLLNQLVEYDTVNLSKISPSDAICLISGIDVSSSIIDNYLLPLINNRQTNTKLKLALEQFFINAAWNKDSLNEFNTITTKLVDVLVCDKHKVENILLRYLHQTMDKPHAGLNFFQTNIIDKFKNLYWESSQKGKVLFEPGNQYHEKGESVLIHLIENIANTNYNEPEGLGNKYKCLNFVLSNYNPKYNNILINGISGDGFSIPPNAFSSFSKLLEAIRSIQLNADPTTKELLNRLQTDREDAKTFYYSLLMSPTANRPATVKSIQAFLDDDIKFWDARSSHTPPAINDVMKLSHMTKVGKSTSAKIALSGRQLSEAVFSGCIDSLSVLPHQANYRSYLTNLDTELNS